MEQNQESVLIYNVKVNTEQGQQDRKAIDLVGLKQFLEDRKSNFTIFNLQLDKIEQDDKIYPFIARAALAIIDELEESVNTALGLNKPEEPPEEPEVVTPQPVQPPQPAQPEIPQPVQPEVKPADTEKVVL